MKLDTIGKKLMIPVTALTIILLVGLGAAMVLNSQSSIQAMMDSKGNSLANLLEQISAPYISNYDFPALEGFVAEAAKDPDVAFVVFSDKTGKALTKNSQAPADTSALALYQREIKDPSGGKLAVLAIGYSKETLSRMLREGVIRIAVSVLLAIVLTLLGLVFVTRNITGILKRVIAGMSEGTETVASVSSQVASASQALADGASQQASGIEEASASVEEMASMTRQNADNAGQANSMMAETRKVMDMANQSMAELTTAMGDISNASQETAKIIKTIDEIAFQTNLLALNAAVEAARAGEAGAGFAVVADEVRNLAIRAAEAAKNTAALIEGTVKKIQLGSGIVAKTNEAFSTVANGARKVGELVEEISAASNEQAQGVQQINRAIAEMEKVVQVNAAGAEESASAAQEMNAQAERMREHVGDLMSIVGGRANGSGAAVGQGGLHLERSVSPRMPALPEKRTGRPPAVTARPSRKVVDPERVIPMKDSEFRDF